MKKKSWLLLVPGALILFLGIIAVRLAAPRVVIYTEQMTYTMKDDQSVYLLRRPMIYVEPALPGYTGIMPERIRSVVEAILDDATSYVEKAFKYYCGHCNLDYACKVEDGNIIITYMGHGKLRDGTLEAIDDTYSYPVIRFEDQTAGLWDPPRYPGVTYGPEKYQDPEYVLDIPWPEDTVGP